MSRGDFLGEFEQAVMLTLARLNERAYGMAIREEIERRTERNIGIGSVYSALDRLERKGHVSSTLGDPTPERGGRAKRYYRLEAKGRLVLANARGMQANLWEGLQLDTEGMQ